VAVQATTSDSVASESRGRTHVVDTDVHNNPAPGQLLPYLPERWATYLKRYGQRTSNDDGLIRAKMRASRTDAMPPGGGIPGCDPDFAREQLLDPYGISLAILNNMSANAPAYVGGNQPREFSEALQRANNDWTKERWLDADPRWRASVTLPFEEPARSAKEIERCCEDSDKWVQAGVSHRTHHPIGHEKYWPMIEALVHFDIPLSLHPGGNGKNRVTGSGFPAYYYEDHVGYPQAVYSQIASLIFEGTFDRWPTLKIVILEGGWSWAAPYAWRLDACWKLLRDERPELQRRPSEYIRDHVWFSSQPIEEPEDPKWFNSVFEQLESVGLGDHLMFSSDYPHWDFDSPDQALPLTLPEETRQRIFSGNALALYRFPKVAVAA
jgi:uncharacterized protein